MKIQKFKDVTILHINKKISISKFKKGQRKIRKIDYKDYDYDWAINLILFYIAFSRNKHIKGWSIDFNSNLGLIRVVKRSDT